MRRLLRLRPGYASCLHKSGVWIPASRRDLAVGHIGSLPNTAKHPEDQCTSGNAAGFAVANGSRSAVVECQGTTLEREHRHVDSMRARIFGEI
jgi:hypothetical protein